MSIPSEVKRAISKDWLREFPELSSYSQNKLYKVIGPTIAGIEIFKQPRADEYRPYFVSYGLWKPNLRECFQEPLTIQEMRDKKGLQFDIPYLNHSRYFAEVVECTKNQILLPLNQDVRILTIFEMIDHELNKVLVRSSPVNQAKLYEFKYFAALYVGKETHLDEVTDEIRAAGKKWDPKLFEWKHGSFARWLDDLVAKHRSDFLTRIEANRSDKKVLTLPWSDLTP